MKLLQYLPVIFFLGLTTCCTAQHELSDVKWLSGEWKRLNMNAGKSGSESWRITSDTTLIGRGVTMRGTDTVFVEKLRITLRKGTLYYIADVAENAAPVAFKFTLLSSTSFTCENPQHDFPKRITYSLEENELKATIAGNGKSIAYSFEKVK